MVFLLAMEFPGIILLIYSESMHLQLPLKINLKNVDEKMYSKLLSFESFLSET